MSPTRLPKAKLPVEPEGSKKNNNKNPRARHLLKKFGITDEQYRLLYDKQGGCCAICGVPAKNFRYNLAVDHDHTSGEIRGLLCFRCNKYIIGRHSKERSLLLLRAFEYLTREYPGWIVPPKTKKKRKKRRRK